MDDNIRMIQLELENRRSRNAQTRLEVEAKERDKQEGRNLLVERDRLQSELEESMKVLTAKRMEMMEKEMMYKVMVSENDKLKKELSEMEKREGEFDRVIEEFAKKSEAQEKMKASLSDSVIRKQEKVVVMQMNVEESGRRKMEVQAREIAEKMKTSKETAIQYLLKCVEFLEEEASRKGKK